MEALQKEAEHRENGKIVDVECYHCVRRGSSAAPACFALSEPALGIILPEEVVHHPTFQEISLMCVDLYCWANVSDTPHTTCRTLTIPSRQDLYSFNMERSRGIDAANVITILIKHKGYTLQQAVDHAGGKFGGLVQRLVQARQFFPRFGPEIDCAVDKYIDAMGMLVIGFMNWAFETDRYFGQMGEEVKKTRIVKLFPRRC